MEEVFWEEEIWRCRKHPSRPRSGICPVCLRDRLLRLCPDCACVRPCGCCASSSSSSSFSSLSSADLARSIGANSGIGAVGRVAHLIGSEPAFRRSRSAAFQFLLPVPPATAGGGDAARPRAQGGRMWAALWPFSRSAAAREDEEETAGRAVAAAKFSRSSSVGVTSFPDAGAGGEVRLKAWNWHFPSPMKAFRHRKSARVVQERSPLCRG